MAITKMIGAIHKSKTGNVFASLKRLIKYINDPDKTAGEVYTGTLGCTNPYEDMVDTIKFYHKEPKNEHDRIAYHYTLSWRSDSTITPELAMQITEEFCLELLSDYEVAYSVHIDKEHIHSHIVFNAVSFKTGLKYRYNDNDWEKIIQPVTDKLCTKYGLHTLEMDLEEERRKKSKKEKNQERSYKRKKYQSYSEDEKKKKKRSNNQYYSEKGDFYRKSDHIKVDIDDAVYRSKTWETFLNILKEKGYEYKCGKHFAVLGPGMRRYRRTYQLGADYSEEAIRRRIAIHDKPLPDYEIPEEKDNMYSNIYRRKIKLTEQSRHHYAAQYKAGLLKPGQNRSYYVIKQSLRNLSKMEEEQKILRLNKVTDILTAGDAIKTYDEKIKQVDQRKKEFFFERKPYMHLIEKYRQYLKDVSKEEELVEILNLHGLTKEDFADYYENMMEKMKQLNKEKRQILREKNVIEKYADEYNAKIERDNPDVQFTRKQR